MAPASHSLSRYLLKTLAVSLVLSPAMVCLAQTTVTAAAVNGVLNPTQFPGSDLGAQVAAAWASGLGKTVRIPAGNYNSFNTPIVLPGAGYTLQCDVGAILNYTGSGAAITIGSDGNIVTDTGVDGQGGCLLNNSGSASYGIEIFPSNHTFIRDMRITGFSYGIFDYGGNNLTLENLLVQHNSTGIVITNNAYLNGYAANAVHLSHSEVSSNATWGFYSEASSTTCCALNYGTVVTDNVFEQNGSGDVWLDWDKGAYVSGNYFESGGTGVSLGTFNNVWGITVAHNYFTSSSSTGDRITVGYGTYFHIEENAENGATSNPPGCFIDIVTGPNGGSGYFFGGGTNFVQSAHEWCKHGSAFTP